MYQFGKLVHPGFTITYKQSIRPELIRFSPFYDWNAAFSPPELSDHWSLPSSLLSSISSSTGDDNNYPKVSAVVSLPASSLEGPVSLPTGSIVNPIFGTTLSGLVPTATAIVTAIVQGDRTSDQRPSETPIPMADTVEVEAPALCSFGLVIHTIQSKFNDIFTIAKSRFQSIRPNVAMVQHSLSSFPSPPDSASSGVPVSMEDGSPNVPEASLTSLISSNKLIEAPYPSPTPFFIQKSSRDHVIRALKISSFAFIIVCISALVFSHFISSPRRRADRAARREECRNRRLYQHAAHKIMWQRRWEALLSKFVSRDTPTTVQSAWDEKLLPPLPTLSTQESIRDEIQAMVNTYKVVDSIVQAEEGRSARSAPSQKFVLRRWERRTSRTSRSSSDATGPPPYEELLNGYHYIPPESDTTPDSSVIDTSSRNDSDCEKD